MDPHPSRSYVVAIGGATVDIAGFGEKAIRERDSNPGSIRLSHGGVARNIAENLVRLQIDTKLMTALGDDPFGNLIFDRCSDLGIDLSCTKVASGMTTAVYLSVIDHRGDMHVAVSDMRAVDALDIGHLIRHAEVLQKASAIVVDTNLTEEVLLYLIDRFRRKLFLDTVSAAKAEKVAGRLQNVHTIKPNRAEARMLVGSALSNEGEVRDAVRYFIDRGVRQVAITLGREGVAYGSRNQFEVFRPPPVVPVNATGAGDAFMAGLVYGKIWNLPLGRTVRFASALAHLTLQDENTNSPDLSVDTAQQKLREFE